MSPEYKNIRNVPGKIKDIAKISLMEKGIDYTHAAEKGFGFCMPNGHITQIDFLENLEPHILNLAKNEKSPWHIVLGIQNPFGSSINGKNKKEEGDLVYKNSPHYRGKHRSVNKGTGFDAFMGSLSSKRHVR